MRFLRREMCKIPKGKTSQIGQKWNDGRIYNQQGADEAILGKIVFYYAKAKLNLFEDEADFEPELGFNSKKGQRKGGGNRSKWHNYSGSCLTLKHLFKGHGHRTIVTFYFRNFSRFYFSTYSSSKNLLCIGFFQVSGFPDILWSSLDQNKR